jgi:hypothetical protein
VASVTVLFRPFPWEVSSGPGVLAALEGIVLIGLLIGARHQIVALPKTAVRYPYVLYSLLFTLAFVVAFSTISNFGILVRQRAQLLPLFLVLLVPPRTPSEEDEDEDDGEAHSAAKGKRPQSAARASRTKLRHPQHSPMRPSSTSPG